MYASNLEEFKRRVPLDKSPWFANDEIHRTENDAREKERAVLIGINSTNDTSTVRVCVPAVQRLSALIEALARQSSSRQSHVTYTASRSDAAAFCAIESEGNRRGFREETLSLRRAPSLVSWNGNGDEWVKQRARCHTYTRARGREREIEGGGGGEKEQMENRATTMTTVTRTTKTMTITMEKFVQARLPIRSAHASLLTIPPTSLESFPWVK